MSMNYTHTNGISAITGAVSIPLPIFNRNQSEIARTGHVIAQAQEQQRFVSGQVYTDVKDAWEAVQSNERLVKIYEPGTLADAKRSLEISDYAYHHGALALLDLLNAERNYRAVELAWRQAVAAYLAALRSSLRQATGTEGACHKGDLGRNPCIPNEDGYLIMTVKADVCARIAEIGILPAARVSASADAQFAAEVIYRSAGIPVIEITMTVPGAIEVIAHVAKALPDMVVGAGTVLDTETAQRCLDAGAKFITSTGLVMDVVEFAVKNGITVKYPAL